MVSVHNWVISLHSPKYLTTASSSSCMKKNLGSSFVTCFCQFAGQSGSQKVKTAYCMMEAHRDQASLLHSTEYKPDERKGDSPRPKLFKEPRFSIVWFCEGGCSQHPLVISEKGPKKSQICFVSPGSGLPLNGSNELSNQRSYSNLVYKQLNLKTVK